MAKGLPSMVEVLKKQLTLSESTVRDLREQIHTLQITVEQLTQENSELKRMLQVTMQNFILYTTCKSYYPLNNILIIFNTEN